MPPFRARAETFGPAFFEEIEMEPLTRIEQALVVFAVVIPICTWLSWWFSGEVFCERCGRRKRWYWRTSKGGRCQSCFQGSCGVIIPASVSGGRAGRTIRPAFPTVGTSEASVKQLGTAVAHDLILNAMFGGGCSDSPFNNDGTARMLEAEPSVVDAPVVDLTGRPCEPDITLEPEVDPVTDTTLPGWVHHLKTASRAPCMIDGSPTADGYAKHTDVTCFGGPQPEFLHQEPKAKP